MTNGTYLTLHTRSQADYLWSELRATRNVLARLVAALEEPASQEQPLARLERILDTVAEAKEVLR